MQYAALDPRSDGTDTPAAPRATPSLGVTLALATVPFLAVLASAEPAFALGAASATLAVAARERLR